MAVLEYLHVYTQRGGEGGREGESKLHLYELSHSQLLGTGVDLVPEAVPS